jgi:ketosteroid isomerase-like protein
MNMNLPPPIASFFHAFNAKDTDALLGSFTPDAFLADEGNEYRGTAAIKGWFETVNTKYKPTAEATDFADVGGEIVVTTQVSGAFPGSPIQLHYTFTLNDDRVAALSIVN